VGGERKGKPASKYELGTYEEVWGVGWMDYEMEAWWAKPDSSVRSRLAVLSTTNGSNIVLLAFWRVM